MNHGERGKHSHVQVHILHMDDPLEVGMSLRHVFSAAALGATLACAANAGNDPSLAPAVRADSAQFTALMIRPVSSAEVAVFAVDHGRSGWTLRLLGVAEGPSAIVPAGQAQPRPPSGPIAAMAGTRPAWYFTPYCLPSFPPATSLGYVIYRCQPFWQDVPPAPASRRSPSAAGSAPRPAYVVLIASRSHLAPERWQALADSMGAVGTMARMPSLLGALAFSDDSAAHWQATLQWLPQPAGSDAEGVRLVPASAPPAR